MESGLQRVARYAHKIGSGRGDKAIGGILEENVPGQTLARGDLTWLCNLEQFGVI